MIVTYLKTEIDVRSASSGSGETAFARIDGERRCFLGGLAEAKQFLKERKQGPHYGPRPASWDLTLADSGCVSTYRTLEHAMSSFDYFVREGRIPTITRREYCAYAGCDGHGDITFKRRGSMFSSSRPCPLHDEPVAIVECTAAAAARQVA